MGSTHIYDKNTQLIPGGNSDTRPLEPRVEGGLTGVFRNQRKISFYFVQFLHSEVAWEAQSSILSVKLYMNIRGTTPQGAPPQISAGGAVCKG
jgi:hypothetical protein